LLLGFLTFATESDVIHSDPGEVKQRVGDERDVPHKPEAPPKPPGGSQLMLMGVG